ncbi:hypothetical protein JM93_00036 [Roseibium hamelinense]|uniref:Uncharacterized protein n=1 Tax=Roseibium hamelinense TaxID=150831 RepID=A0A562TH02_9HYPH|nr:hypothetical protein JM93_00036 [Roseibium hamelinense]
MIIVSSEFLEIASSSTRCPSLISWHPAQIELLEGREPRRAVEQNETREVGTLRS